MIKSPPSEKIIDGNMFKNLYYNTNYRNHQHAKFRRLKLAYFEEPNLEVFLHNVARRKTKHKNLVSGT